jgi:uridine phosphorylase
MKQNNSKRIPESELIINPDGSVFHLHILPEDLADSILLFGDQDRVPMAAQFLDKGSIEVDKASREFHTITGRFNGKRISIVSSGIGTDNIDIVMTELDALANVDFKTRLPRK